MPTPTIITIAATISKTLATSRLITKTRPFTNKNNPNIKTNPLIKLILKIPYIQKTKPTKISKLPNTFIIMNCLKKKGF